VAAAVSILRVGVLLTALTTGVTGLSCGPPAPAPPVVVTPELFIPRLDLDGGTAGTPARAGDGVRFGHPPAAVGGAWNVQVRASSRSTDDPQNPSTEQVSEYESDFRVDVLAVDGPAPSRVRLTFARKVHSYQGNPTPSVIHGKAYIVDSRMPHVRDANDAAASLAEAERVLDVFPDLGTRARIDQVLPDDAMHIGERHDDLAGAILRVIHPRAWTLRAGSATLARADGDHAVFTLSIDAAADSGLHMTLTGEARVRLADARLSELTLAGRYERQSPGTAEPPGTFEMHRSVR
jgi:hypothetical protein